MSNEIVSTTVEILGKIYPVRCIESELTSLQEAVKFLNQKMTEVKESGKVINLERIAIITALNIAHLYLDLDHQKATHISKINQRLTYLQDKLEAAMNSKAQMELAYISE